MKQRRQIRHITKEMEEAARTGRCHADLVRLNGIMIRCFGSINRAADAAGIDRAKLHRRMNGDGEFTTEEILRLAFACKMSHEETSEIFFYRYLGKELQRT